MIRKTLMILCPALAAALFALGLSSMWGDVVWEFSLSRAHRVFVRASYFNASCAFTSGNPAAISLLEKSGMDMTPGYCHSHLPRTARPGLDDRVSQSLRIGLPKSSRFAWRAAPDFLFGPAMGLQSCRTTSLRCSLWFPIFALLLVPVCGISMRQIRRYRRRGSGRCLSCGYDLTGNVTGICSECGIPIQARVVSHLYKLVFVVLPFAGLMLVAWLSAGNLWWTRCITGESLEILRYVSRPNPIKSATFTGGFSQIPSDLKTMLQEYFPRHRFTIAEFEGGHYFRQPVHLIVISDARSGAVVAHLPTRTYDAPSNTLSTFLGENPCTDIADAAQRLAALASLIAHTFQPAVECSESFGEMDQSGDTVSVQFWVAYYGGTNENPCRLSARLDEHLRLRDLQFEVRNGVGLLPTWSAHGVPTDKDAEPPWTDG